MNKEDLLVSSIELKEEIKNEPKKSFMASGFAGLDELLGGWGAGDFVVISGEPGMGKTTLAVSLTKRFSSQNLTSLWFSAEMPYEEFFLLFGEHLPLFYVPRNRDKKTVNWIEDKIKDATENFGVKFVFIDHLGLIRDEETAYHKNSIEIIDARLDRLHEIAIKYGVCIIGTSEHNKESMKGKGKAEMHLENLRGTARLGYNATAVLGIERLNGIKTVRNWQDVEDGEVFIRTDMWINVMKSRRTGARKIRIACYMDEEGSIQEYSKGSNIENVENENEE